MEKAGEYRPDFVCFTEVARELGVPRNHQTWKGEPVPGPTTEALGTVARKHQTHVIFGMQELAGNRTFNAAVLIGRDGKVIGIYHKVQPTIGEMEMGTISGIKAPTWETDSPDAAYTGKQEYYGQSTDGLWEDVKFTVTVNATHFVNSYDGNNPNYNTQYTATVTLQENGIDVGTSWASAYRTINVNGQNWKVTIEDVSEYQSYVDSNAAVYRLFLI